LFYLLFSHHVSCFHQTSARSHKTKFPGVVFYERNKLPRFKNLWVPTMTLKMKKKQKYHHDLIFYGGLDTTRDSQIFLFVIVIYQFSRNTALRGRPFGNSLSSVSENKATRVFLLRSVYERQYDVQHQPRQDTALDQTKCDASF